MKVLLSEPLKAYRERFKDEHYQNVSETFSSLVAQSGINVAENIATGDTAYALNAEIENFSAKRSRLKLLATGTISAIAGYWLIVGFFVFFNSSQSLSKAFSTEQICLFGGGGAAISALLIVFLIKRVFRKISAIDKTLDEKQSALKTTLKKAREQLAPLAPLLRGDFLYGLISKTLPCFHFDPEVSETRLRELHEKFGMEIRFGENKAVTDCKSGDLFGNPFVISSTRKFFWGRKTYTGFLDISWTGAEEYYENGEKKYRRVFRTQRLYAEVSKPFPEYAESTVVAYGNDAAENLSFSRNPSPLSASDGGVFSRLAMRREIRRLEKKSRELRGFTMMANKTFEALFCAEDRNNPIEFRMLFTPLAQQEIVKLLQDKKIGPGDSFSFVKARKMNYLFPASIAGMSFRISDDRFLEKDVFDFDIRTARTRFVEINCSYFHRIYFSFAPLFAIPLYLEKSHSAEPESASGRENSTPSAWEAEALAYHIGEIKFQHPESVTKNILKARLDCDEQGNPIAEITAYGFRGETHVDYIRKIGGDGNVHTIAVKWTKYIPVSRKRQISL